MIESSPSEYDENFGLPEQGNPADGEGAEPDFLFAQEDNNDSGADAELPEALRDIDTYGDNPMGEENFDPYPVESASETLPVWVVATATNVVSGNNCAVWLPCDSTHDAPPTDSEGNVELVIGDKPRRFLGSVIEMAYAFNADLAAHTAMGHDCGFFGFANQSNAVPAHTLTPKGEKSRVIWDPSTSEIVTDEAAICPGEIVVLCNDNPDGTVKSPAHLMVKANTDQGPSIYAGKLGTMGLVVLSTLDEISTFYPTDGQLRKGGDLRVE